MGVGIPKYYRCGIGRYDLLAVMRDGRWRQVSTILSLVDHLISPEIAVRRFIIRRFTSHPPKLAQIGSIHDLQVLERWTEKPMSIQQQVEHGKYGIVRHMLGQCVYSGSIESRNRPPLREYRISDQGKQQFDAKQEAKTGHHPIRRRNKPAKRNG